MSPVEVPVNMALSTIDFSRYTAGDAAERLKLAEEMVAGFKKDGAVTLINYDPTENIAAECIQAARDFFSLPLESKMKIANAPGPKPQRGFSVVGVEQTSKLFTENFHGRQHLGALRDAREHFDAGPPDDTEFPNQWPDYAHLPGFRNMLESQYAKLQKLSEQIADAIELGLGMPANQLALRCQPTSSEIRLNHYPSVSLKDLAEGNIKRTWPHTDFGIISLVFQDKIGGLEIEDRSASSPYQRSFAPIPPANQDGSEPVVVLVSDTLQRWTNDVISAGRHQVSVPPFMKKQTEGDCPERYSAVFFLKASRDASVAPFPQFVTEKRPAVYGDMSALQFQQRGTGILY